MILRRQIAKLVFIKRTRARLVGVRVRVRVRVWRKKRNKGNLVGREKFRYIRGGELRDYRAGYPFEEGGDSTDPKLVSYLVIHVRIKGDPRSRLATSSIPRYPPIGMIQTNCWKRNHI